MLFMFIIVLACNSGTRIPPQRPEWQRSVRQSPGCQLAELHDIWQTFTSTFQIINKFYGTVLPWRWSLGVGNFGSLGFVYFR